MGLNVVAIIIFVVIVGVKEEESRKVPFLLRKQTSDIMLLNYVIHLRAPISRLLFSLSEEDHHHHHPSIAHKFKEK